MADLEDVYNLFNPDKKLLDDELIKYYVEIDQNETNIRELQKSLEMGLKTREPIKLLFTGHRGSGKTTSLKRLVSKLNERFFIVSYDAFDMIDYNDTTYIDLLFSILTKILEKASKENIDIGKNLSKRAEMWGSSITRTIISDKGKEGGVNVNIPLYFLEISGRMKSETVTREEIRKQIEPRISELTALINDTVAEIEKTGKQVLIIIDNLDKIDFPKALVLFHDYGMHLAQPMCKIIYTFPIALKSSEKFMQIKINFTDVIIHSNVKIHEKDGLPYPVGKGFMREIVKKRVPLDLFEPDALEYIIDMSGGVVREYVRLVRNSALRAITREKKTITKDAAIEVVDGIKNLYQSSLSDSDYEVLIDVYKTKDLKRNEQLVALLHNLSVLEYKNKQSWCDVNPIVRSIMDDKNLLSKNLISKKI